MRSLDLEIFQMDETITLDQTSNSNQFDFNKVYFSHSYESEESDVFVKQMQTTCKYMTPEEVPLHLKNQSMHSHHDNISFFSLNCRSLNGHWDSVVQLLNNMGGNYNHLFDVIGFSETFHIPNTVSLEIPGYHPMEGKSRDDDNMGGVALFIRENMGHYRYLGSI